MTNIKRVDSGLFQADEQPITKEPDKTGPMQQLQDFGSFLLDKAVKQRDQDAYNDGVKAQLAGNDPTKTAAYTGGGFWDNASSQTSFQKGAQITQGLQIQNQADTQMQQAYLANKDDPTKLEAALQKIREDTLKSTPPELQLDTTRYVMGQSRTYNGQAASDAYSKQLDLQKTTIKLNIQDKRDALENYLDVNGNDGTAQAMQSDLNKLMAGGVESDLIDPADAATMNKENALLVRRGQAKHDFSIHPTQETIASVRDPNGPYRDLGPAVQNQIGDVLQGKYNLNQQAHAGDKAVNDQHLASVEYLLKSGDKNAKFDITAETAKMQQLGYSPVEIQAWASRLSQGQNVRDAVVGLDSLHVSDEADAIKKQQTTVDATADPTLKANELEKLSAMQTRYAQNQKMITEDPIGFVQARFPDEYNKMDFSNEAGAKAAQAAIVAHTGNPNPPIVPQAIIDGYSQALKTAPDAATRGAVLSQINDNYLASAPKILAQMGVTPTQAFASLVQDKQEQADVLGAEQNYGENKTLVTAKPEDQQAAFQKQFPVSAFAGDSKFMGETYSVWQQLTAQNVSRGMDEPTAQATATKTINNTVTVKDFNGQQLLVPKNVDNAKITQSIQGMITNSESFSFVSKNNDGKYTAYSNSEVKAAIAAGKLQIRPNGDGNYKIVDISKGSSSTVNVLTKEGNHAAVLFKPDGTSDAMGYVLKSNASKDDPAWKAPIITDPNKPVGSKPNPGWDGQIENVPVVSKVVPAKSFAGHFGSHVEPAHTDTLSTQTASNAGIQAAKDKLPLDSYAYNLSTNGMVQQDLQGVSHSIKGGTIPDWAMNYMSNIDGMEQLKDPAVKAKVQAAWKANTDHSLSPLQTFFNTVKQSQNLSPASVGRFPTKAQSSNTSLPIGVRNNNPTNLRNGVNWQGSSEGEGGFAAFDKPENGIRAAAKNLLTYQDSHGLNTVQDIVNRWAPSSENDTGSYVKAVAKDMGVDANAKIDLHDPSTLKKLTTAIIKHENGYVPYDDGTIGKAVSNALKSVPQYVAGPKPKGLVETGNIDLNARPVVQNADGSISTVRSMSFEENGKEILVPTVSDDGKILSNRQAIALYHKTGKHLGKFDTPEEADDYAEHLHEAQADQYAGGN